MNKSMLTMMENGKGARCPMTLWSAGTVDPEKEVRSEPLWSYLKRRFAPKGGSVPPQKKIMFLHLCSISMKWDIQFFLPCSTHSISALDLNQNNKNWVPTFKFTFLDCSIFPFSESKRINCTNQHMQCQFSKIKLESSKFQQFTFQISKFQKTPTQWIEI